MVCKQNLHWFRNPWSLIGSGSPVWMLLHLFTLSPLLMAARCFNLTLPPIPRKGHMPITHGLFLKQFSEISANMGGDKTPEAKFSFCHGMGISQMKYEVPLQEHGAGEHHQDQWVWSPAILGNHSIGLLISLSSATSNPVRLFCPLLLLQSCSRPSGL